MIRRNILTGSFLLLLAACSQPVHTSRSWKEITSSETIHVVTEYNPYGFYLGKDTVEGFQISLIQAFARDHGLTVQVSVEMDPEKQKEGLRTARYDIIAHNLLVTLSQVKDSTLLFTHPTDVSRLVLVQRKKDISPDNYITNVLDLGGKELFIPMGSPYTQRLRNLQNEIGDTIIIKEIPRYGAEQITYLVAHGDISRAVVDYPIAARLSEELDQIDFQLGISFNQFYAWAVDMTATELQDTLNSWIDRYSETKEFKQLKNRYLSH